MKTSITSKLHLPKISALTLAAAAVLPVMTTHAADISWTGGTASYTTTANWNPATVPGLGDTAINASGIGNKVQVNVGNPDWSLGQIRAGTALGSGAFEQNGQTVNLSATGRGAVRIGIGAGESGIYTLNDGTINYGSGEFNVGELGTATLNVNGGTINGSGNFAINVGSSLDGVTATVDGGTNRTGFTWFEQGAYPADPSRGLPAAGSTFASQADANTSYTMAASFAANNAVLLNAARRRRP